MLLASVASYRYASYFVPIVLVAAGLTFLFTRDVVRSVAVLVAACPCALVLATLPV